MTKKLNCALLQSLPGTVFAPGCGEEPPDNSFLQRSRWWALILFGVCFSPVLGVAQDFRIASATVGNGIVQISFPSRSDSYYFLHGGSSLDAALSPVDALLGSDGTQVFHRVVGADSMFFRLEAPIRLEMILEMVRRQRELDFAPGEEFLYSNKIPRLVRILQGGTVGCLWSVPVARVTARRQRGQASAVDSPGGRACGGNGSTTSFTSGPALYRQQLPK